VFAFCPLQHLAGRRRWLWGAFGLSVLTLPLLLCSTLPWYLSVPIVACLVAAHQRFLAPSCPGPDRRTPLYVCWFSSLYVLSLAYYFIEMLPAFLASSSFGLLSHATFITANALYSYFYISVVRGDAGVLPQNTFTLSELEHALEANERLGEICPTCLVCQPSCPHTTNLPQTEHCSPISHSDY